NIGIIYESLGNNSEALKNYLACLEIWEKIGDKQGVAICYNNIGVIYQNRGDDSEALKNFAAALKISEEIGDQEGIAIAYIAIGSNYDKQGNYSEALKNLFASLKISEEIGAKHEVASTYNSIGGVYLNEMKIQDALIYGSKGLQLSEEVGSLELIRTAHKTLSVIDSVRNDFQGAYEHFKLYMQMNDSIFNMEKDKKITQLTMQYQFDKQQDSVTTEQNKKDVAYLYEKQLSDEKLSQQEKNLVLKGNELKFKNLALIISNKEKDLERLAFLKERAEKEKKESLLATAEEGRKLQGLSISGLEKDKALQAAIINDTRKNRNITVASLLVIFLFAGTILYQRNQRKKLTFEKKITETELNVFRSQMNPHFMFNALNSIHSFILSKNTDMAANYLEKFSRLMRMILENSTNPMVTLSDDLKALELYMDLEMERLDRKFSYTVNIQKDIDPGTTFIPPLIFQPFVENSIWHGLSEREMGGKINVDISKADNLLKCTISDNGRGMKKTSAKSKSYGISITRQRIENLNKVHKTNAYCNVEETLDTENHPTGVRVELGLPLVTDER
ncbi:MAG: tetratricopeptide repeat protein, partial [Saprospiraceae bacterium]